MWIVIFITPNKETAMRAKKLLQQAGLLVSLRSVGLRGNEQYGCYEVLVPESEVTEGHNLLIQEVF